MPIYEYKCTECGAHIEKMQKVSDEPLKVCESCGGKLEKQLSLSGFQFKGEGWYVTDYSKKSSGGKEETKSDKSEKIGKTDKSEKSSSGDSTVKTESASKETKDTKTASKKN